MSVADTNAKYGPRALMAQQRDSAPAMRCTELQLPHASRVDVHQEVLHLHPAHEARLGDDDPRGARQCRRLEVRG